MSSEPISLQPGDVIIIDGVKIAYDEIINNKIDSVIYRKHLQIRGDAE